MIELWIGLAITAFVGGWWYVLFVLPGPPADGQPLDGFSCVVATPDMPDPVDAVEERTRRLMK